MALYMLVWQDSMVSANLWNFVTMLNSYPLRVGMGDIAITNHQGFFIDALDT